MSGYAYGDKEPMAPCPYCGATCRADFADIGVGYQQCGPYQCEKCRASEIGPYDKARDLVEAEKATGWYLPESEPGSSANVIGGKIVSHDEARAAYTDEFWCNPKWHDAGYVQEWWAAQRNGKLEAGGWRMNPFEPKQISADEVNRYREQTGAGMLEAKRHLRLQNATVAFDRLMAEGNTEQKLAWLLRRYAETLKTAAQEAGEEWKKH